MAFKSYIKIPRELFCSEEWAATRKFSRFEAQIDLLRSAAYADGFVVYCATRDVVLKRGQLLTSQRDLAERWGWSPATVNRYLQMLRNARRNSIRIQIETTIETGKTLITICNYDEWDFEVLDNETPDETRGETPSETRHETRIELNSSIIENKDKLTHIVFEKGGAGGNDLVAWIRANVPTIAAMREPITEQNAVWMLRKYPLDDIRRLIYTMHSKEAYKCNTNAYATFVTYAKNDLVLKNTPNRKLYTYEEFCDLTGQNGRYSSDDFELVQIDGRPMRKLKINPYV